MISKATQVAIVLGVATASAGAISFAQGGAQAVPPTVPSGVTLVEVMRELELSQPQLLWVRVGDEQGRTLFTSATDKPGVSNCIDACAEEWAPFIASKGAKAAGD